MSLKELDAEIKKLEARARSFRTIALEVDSAIARLKKEKQKICPHKNVEIRINSYEEAPRIRYSEWREKVCKDCGKVIAVAETKEVWKSR